MHGRPAPAPTTLVGLFAGPVRSYRSARAPGRPATAWRSAIDKAALDGPVAIDHDGLAGDRQHDRRHHGGPTKAVLCYAAEHYADWAPLAAAHLATLDEAAVALPTTRAFGPGAFGENLLLAGVDESRTCLGDAWRIGEVVLRITEPRGPCGTLARRWCWPALVGHVRRTARAGWYCAVEAPGIVRLGDVATLVERRDPEWTVARAFALLEARVAPREAVQALHDSPAAHPALRARLARRLTTPGRTR